MVFLIAAIVSACIFAIMFRICAKWDVDIHSVMAANYILGALIFGREFTKIDIPVLIIGSISASLFILGFIFRNRCTAKCGIAITSITAKSSLIIPVILSWLILCQQSPSWLTLILVILGISIISYGEGGKFHIDLPILFILYGLCNFSLPLAKFLGMKSAVLTACIFIAATIISVVICIVNKSTINVKGIIAGTIMGAANVSSVFFSLEALDKMDATLFYPIFDGAIVTICSLAGIAIFKERIGIIQTSGLIITAIGIILFYTK